MEPLTISKIIEYLLAILLIVLIGVGGKIYLILSDVRNVTKRIETLTDITGWLGFFRKISKKK